jgi:hypothetical protein
MMVPNDVFKLLTETWNEILAERDVLRREVAALRVEVDTLRQRDAERLQYAGLSRREQRQVVDEVFDRIIQLLETPRLVEPPPLVADAQREG